MLVGGSDLADHGAAGAAGEAATQELVEGRQVGGVLAGARLHPGGPLAQGSPCKDCAVWGVHRLHCAGQLWLLVGPGVLCLRHLQEVTELSALLASCARLHLHVLNSVQL